jgi:hypothetical protein
MLPKLRTLACKPELLEQLPDGTDRTTPAFPPSIIYRDSQARIRIEYSIPPSRRVRPPFDNPWVEIQDPLAGHLYVLDPVHHIAHRVTLHRPEAVTRPAFVYAAPDANAPGDTVYLGTKFMFGVTLTGRKTTSVSRMRNGESTTNVVEIWTDPQTNVEVLRKMIGSHGGYTKTIQNYSNAEPDSALFLVPAGYQVVDESGPFTIEVSLTTEKQ